jgi:hypothetical protein
MEIFKVKTSKLIVVLAFVSLLSIASFAQDYPKFEVPVGFSFVNVHPNLAPITSFNVFGGGGGFVYNVNSMIGIKADFYGYTQGSGLRDQLKQDGLLAGSANGNVFTYMFGPQFKKHSGKFQPFGEALFGAAHTNAYATILTDEGKLVSGSGNNNGFAMEFGGGLDIPLTKTIQFRPVEVDYLATHFGANHVANYSAWQNNFKYVAGVNFTFGGK